MNGTSRRRHMHMMRVVAIAADVVDESRRRRVPNPPQLKISSRLPFFLPLPSPTAPIL